MNARKHVVGFAIFSVILGSSILINHFLTRPEFAIRVTAAPRLVVSPVIERKPRPFTYRVRQVSLDYIHKKSYTELRLELEPGQPAPEKIWVITTFFSPDSALAESWVIVTEIRQPLSRSNREVVVAADEWTLPPYDGKHKLAYFARVEVSAQAQGNFYPPEYESNGDFSHAAPVVVHWPDEKSVSAAAKKFSR